MMLGDASTTLQSAAINTNPQTLLNAAGSCATPGYINTGLTTVNCQPMSTLLAIVAAAGVGLFLLMGNKS